MLGFVLPWNVFVSCSGIFAIIRIKYNANIKNPSLRKSNRLKLITTWQRCKMCYTQVHDSVIFNYCDRFDLDDSTERGYYLLTR